MLARTVSTRRGTADLAGVRRAWRRAAFWLALAVNLAVLYAPSVRPAQPGVPGLDKAVHVGSFAVLTAAGLAAGLAPRWFLPAVLAHALVSEAVQAAVLPARSGDVADVVADVAGVALGYAASRGGPRRAPWGRGRARREPRRARRGATRAGR